MATLNLFPARVPFVDSNGLLTTEAYRALQVLFDRVGGAQGDSGVDTYAPQSSYPSINYFGVEQPCFSQNTLPDIVQPASPAALANVVLPSGSVAAPSLSWDLDFATGFYRIGSNNIGFSVSGSKVLDLSSTGISVTGTVSTSVAVVGGGANKTITLGTSSTTSSLSATGDTYIGSTTASTVYIITNGVAGIILDASGHVGFGMFPSGAYQLEMSGGLTAPLIKPSSALGYKAFDGSAGITTTVTTASLVGKTITIKDGIITAFA